MDFELFYNKWSGKLLGYLLRMTGNRELARDIMQESFTRCLACKRDMENPKAFLFTVARNLVFDYHRLESRRRVPEPQPQAGDPESALLEQEKASAVLEAFNSLPQNEREILAMAAEKTLSYRDIAKVCGISEAAVKVRVHRARKKLRKLLG